MSSTRLGLSEAQRDYDAMQSNDAVQPPAPRARRVHEVSPDTAPYEARSPRPYQPERPRIDANGVRTVRIRGQATPARRRPSIQIDRYDRHPDRAAQWALFMGVFMVVVAIITGS